MRVLLVVLLGLSAASCAPVPHGPYYRPQASEPARTIRPWCGGAAGPLTILVMSVASTEIRMWLDRRGAALAGLVSVEFPDTAQLRVVSDVFVVEDRASGERRTPRVQAQGGTGGRGRSARVLTFHVDGFAPARARVQLPTLQLDGEALVIPPIDFDYLTTDWGLYPWNC